MVQRKKAPKSRSKELSEARPTSRRSRAAHTDPECLCADVNALVTQRMIGLAKRQLGAVPQFWGRYFKGPGDQNPVRYQAQLEGPVLRTNNIRVLPIAQQTNHVDGDGPLGSQDGLRNAAAIIASFGRTYLSAMRGIFVFLDVEGPPMQSLHAEYYRGWSDALIAGGQSDMVFRDADNADPITFWPGVYCAEGDDNTWNSLVAAIADGAVCRGTWIARPGKIGCRANALQKHARRLIVGQQLWQPGNRQATAPLLSRATKAAPMSSIVQGGGKRRAGMVGFVEQIAIC